MKVRLKQKNSGVIKEVPIGFSWTTFFFGPLVPLFRQDLLWFFIDILISIFTFGIGWFAIPFIYNKIYIKNLIEKHGYIPADENSKKILVEKNIYIAE